jgi:hypothetical protein
MSTSGVWSLAHHHRAADTLLIRQDAHIAWAETIDQPADTAPLAPREALSCWFGTPFRKRHWLEDERASPQASSVAVMS